MRLLAILSVILTLVCSSATQAQPSAATARVQATPPARPLPMTTAQFEALRQMEASGPHAAVNRVQATYADREKSLKFTTASDDFWTVFYSGGLPGSIITVLICAAPL